MKIESHVTAVIEGKKQAPFTASLLKLMSHLYRGGQTLHRALYTHLPAAKQLSIPVVSIGGIVAGGSGKTPFVRYLAQAFGDKKVAILSRGYKGTAKRNLLVSKETRVEVCGDEPKWLAETLPGVAVFVGSNRFQSGLMAQDLGCKWALLDDGFQHRKLKRDRDIIVMDASNLFGKGHFLPRGYLRDHPKRLGRADLIVLLGTRDQSHLDEVRIQLKAYTDAPVTAMERIVENPEAVSGKKIASFCAIAKPERFQKTLESLNCSIVLKREKADHEPFTQKEMEQLDRQARAKGAEALVCTEKDAIKLDTNLPFCMPIIALKTSLRPLVGEDFLKTLIHGVLS